VGVGRIFYRGGGAMVDFFRWWSKAFFPGGPTKIKFHFANLEVREKHFLVGKDQISKSSGQAPGFCGPFACASFKRCAWWKSKHFCDKAVSFLTLEFLLGSHSVFTGGTWGSRENHWVTWRRVRMNKRQACTLCGDCWHKRVPKACGHCETWAKVEVKLCVWNKLNLPPSQLQAFW